MNFNNLPENSLVTQIDNVIKKRIAGKNGI